MTLGVFDLIADIVKTPLERLLPDKAAREKFQHEIEKEAIKAGLAQMEVNQAEARHSSIFVAGWRPFVGWVCGIALLWHFVLYDLIHWLVLAIWPGASLPPALNGTETLTTILLSMLGLGGLRTVEKIKKSHRDRL